MGHDEFAAILDRLGATPAAFASLVGAAPRVGQRWRSGRDAIPPGIATLARLADAVAGRMPYADLAKLLRDEAARIEVAAQARG